MLKWVERIILNKVKRVKHVTFGSKKIKRFDPFVTCLLNCQSDRVTHKSCFELTGITNLTKKIVFGLTINLLADQAKMITHLQISLKFGS
jgi:hypothetical protein